MTSPTINARTALNTYCYTSERTWEGTVYTISDTRCPELNGRHIIARLDHGIDVIEWMPHCTDPGYREIREGLNGSGAKVFCVGRNRFDTLAEAQHWLEWC